jgi:hypothetical protein
MRENILEPISAKNKHLSWVFVTLACLYFFSQILKDAIALPWWQLLALFFFSLGLFYGFNFLCTVIIKDKIKSGIFSIFTLFFLIFYERFHSIIIYIALPLSRIRYVVPFYVLLYIIVAFLLLKKMKASYIPRIAFCMNFIFTVLFVYSLSLLLFPVAQKDIVQRKTSLEAENIYPVMLNYKPDIYYLILDSYTSSESLKKYWNYDNSPFETELERRGFVVAQQSKAFSSATQLSMCSSLNMSNDESLIKRNNGYLLNAISDNIVVQEAIQRGYLFINYSLFDIDGQKKHYTFIDYDVTNNIFDVLNHVIKNSLIGSVFIAFRSLQADIGQTNLDMFSEIPNCKLINGGKSPLLIYAHLMTPHAPFRLDANGQLKSIFDSTIISNEKEYLKQLEGTNVLLLKCIDSILGHYTSINKPLIIIQGDHGYRFLSNALQRNTERWTIMNSYLLPGEGNKNIYPNISPYNSFRVIFNTYFQTKYPILPDLY